MFPLCYVQWLGYLQHIVLPSPRILLHYTKFDARTITMLEKLLGSKSFGIIMGHLACCQVIFFTSLGGLGLPLVVQRVAPTFLICWDLIVLTLTSCFQQDDHPTLVDVVAHVKIGTYPFQVALWDTHAMFPKVI